MKQLFRLYICFCVCLLLVFVSTSSAQVGVTLEPDVLTQSDTVWVDVRIGLGTDSTSIRPISAYKFRVHTADGLEFVSSDESYSLTDRNGWTSGYSAENGKVGAFSSTADAIHDSGVLVRLQFLLTSTDTLRDIELLDFRLNSGDPDHYPVVPSLHLELSTHED